MSTSDLVSRLAHLEKQVTRLRGLVVFLAAGLASIVAIGLARPTERRAPATDAKVVQAEEFSLIDSAGKSRAKLYFRRGDPTLCFFDASERARAKVFLGEQGPGIVFADTKGTTRCELTERTDGEFLQFNAEDGKGRLTLDLTKNGPSLHLHDTTGNQSAILQVDDNRGGAQVGFLDKTGKWRALLGMMPDQPRLLIQDQHEMVVWKAPPQ